MVLCGAVSCGDPGVPTNGRRIGDQFLYQDQVTFVCDDGYYQSSGPVGGVRECLITGEWSGTQPQCSREYSTQQGSMDYLPSPSPALPPPSPPSLPPSPLPLQNVA